MFNIFRINTLGYIQKLFIDLLQYVFRQLYHCQNKLYIFCRGSENKLHLFLQNNISHSRSVFFAMSLCKHYDVLPLFIYVGVKYMALDFPN